MPYSIGLCKCGQPAKLSFAYKDPTSKNFGKWFEGCSSRQCKHYKSVPFIEAPNPLLPDHSGLDRDIVERVNEKYRSSGVPVVASYDSETSSELEDPRPKKRQAAKHGYDLPPYTQETEYPITVLPVTPPVKRVKEEELTTNNLKEILLCLHRQQDLIARIVQIEEAKLPRDPRK